MKTTKKFQVMNKVVGVFGIALPLFFLAGCSDSETQALKQENAQLQIELKEAEASFNEMLQTFSEVEENLALIKDKQGIIMLDSNNPELTSEKRKQIIEDIKNINTLMEQNRQKIADLQQELSKSGLKVINFQKKVNALMAQVSEKEKEVERMKEVLTHKDFEIAALNVSVSNLHGTLDTLNSQVATQSSALKQMDTDLNTSYFAEGTFKELKEKGLIVAEGWTPWTGKKLNLNENLSPEQFAKFDKREVTSIPLNVKKAELVSDHPSDSYEFEKTEDGLIASLEIRQPDEFWKLSRYLVVEVK